ATIQTGSSVRTSGKILHSQSCEWHRSRTGLINRESAIAIFELSQKMQKRVNKPKHTCRIANWPAVTLLLLLSGLAVPGYCLDRNPSRDGTVQKAQAIWLSTG